MICVFVHSCIRVAIICFAYAHVRARARAWASAFVGVRMQYAWWLF